MNILELKKVGAKDLIEHKGQYFEAKRLLDFLKLCKKVKNLTVDYCSDKRQIIIEHTHGLAKFNPVELYHFESMDQVTWFYPYESFSKYVRTNKKGKEVSCDWDHKDARTIEFNNLKTGKAWSVEL